MPSPLGPEAFNFEVNHEEDTTVIKFTTKASLSSEEFDNAIEDLSDFLWDEEELYEVDDLTYESDLPAEEIVQRLTDLGFAKR